MLGRVVWVLGTLIRRLRLGVRKWHDSCGQVVGVLLIVTIGREVMRNEPAPRRSGNSVST
jgi:hypothetical protein